MERKAEKVIHLKREGQSVLERRREIFFGRLFALSPEKTIDFILEQKEARQLVQQLSFLDLYWLIKKIGEDDSIPLLGLASEEQWQYILDLEVWNRDRIDIKKVSIWLKRFMEADAERLAKWLITEDMEMFVYYYLYRSMEVLIGTDDNIYELSEDFFTLDGTFYLRLKDGAQQQMIEHLLKLIASQDFLKYQALLMTSRAILPASTEEELYRLRNVRIAEYGFLPFEEAISIYAPIDPMKLITKKGEKGKKEVVIVDDEIRGMIPSFPMHQLQTQGTFYMAIQNIRDNMLMDRIRLEFAGLCNQIISADGLFLADYEDLKRICTKAAGYLSIAIESLCGDEVNRAIELIRNNTLVSIFRAGFGIPLKLKWEVEKWIKDSWFKKYDLELDFWGSEWGDILRGLLMKRPMYYVGIEDGEEYRPFESLSEVERCKDVFYGVRLLDQLFSRITSSYPLEKRDLIDPAMSFHPLLFTFWARKVLGLPLGFAKISMDQVREFFGILRSRDKMPPYRMQGFKERFIHDMEIYLSGPEVEKVLSLLWDEFAEEYEEVDTKDIDERYLRFLIVG